MLTSLGAPCNADGSPLTSGTSSDGHTPLSSPPPPPNPFWPFRNRHEFDWVIHYVTDLSASKRQISKGLDLWLSSTLHPGYSGPPVPWQNVQEMYETVDAIQQGAVPWQTYEIRYQGPVDANSPKWKLQTYQLSYRDVVRLMEEQIANPDFKDNFYYVPFMELDEQGEPIYSEFFSGEWSWAQCVCYFIIGNICFVLTLITGRNRKGSCYTRVVLCPCHWWQRQDNRVCRHRSSRVSPSVCECGKHFKCGTLRSWYWYSSCCYPTHP
jgi:hypothetical protein